MATAEAPQFTNTEAKREEMLTEMRTISEQSEVSSEQLKKLIYLMWERDDTDETKGQYDAEWTLQNNGNPIRLYVSDPEENYVDIVFLDGLGDMTGETLRLSDDGHDLNWHVGIIDSFHSTFLGRRVKITEPGEFLIADKLSNVECAKAAKMLVGVYEKQPDFR